MSAVIRCAAEGYHGGDLPPATVVANVGCVHEHVWLEVGVCRRCLDGLQRPTLWCTECFASGCRNCRMLVTVLRNVEAVPA